MYVENVFVLFHFSVANIIEEHLEGNEDNRDTKVDPKVDANSNTRSSFQSPSGSGFLGPPISIFGGPAINIGGNTVSYIYCNISYLPCLLNIISKTTEFTFKFPLLIFF